jgi:regulator of replication initiation timing
MPSVTGVHPAPELSVPPKVIPKVQESREAEQKMAHLEDKLKTLQTELHTKTMTEDRILELQKQLTDLLSEKSTMQDELTKLRRQMDNAAQTAPQPVTPAAQPSAAKPGQPTVSVITSRDAAVKVGLPRLTNVPNVPTGIIKDDANNLLPGILVTVTNSESMPMRAFKTNKLGQFGASTPLPNGTYLVEIEDPRGRFTFDRAQITLNNVVLPPLEIIAKSQKQLTREKLAQEIFGGGMQ